MAEDPGGGVDGTGVVAEIGVAGPTVVLLHGLGGDLRRVWHYGPPGYGRLAADARAHGTAMLDENVPLDFGLLTGDLASLLETRRPPRPILLAGVSMGAATALRFALDHPDEVAGLVLVRPAWLDEPSPANLEVFASVAAHLRAAGPEGGAERFRRTSLAARLGAQSPSALASVLGQFRAPRALERVRRLEELPRSAPVGEADDLDALREIPTTVVYSAHDPIHPAALADDLVKLIPGAKGVEVAPRDEAPAAFERGIADAVRLASERLVGARAPS